MRWLVFHYGWFGFVRKPRSDQPPRFRVRQFFAALARARTLVLVGFIFAFIQSPVLALGSRIKDLVMVGGARDNQLSGWGLVVGLANDGDKDPVYTVQAIANALQRYGITVPAATLESKNVSAVFVTADIKPFLKSGSRVDVTVSAMGDAKSLSGGVLLQTPLLGIDGKTYALAQGPLAVGGFSAGVGGAGGANIQKIIRQSPKSPVAPSSKKKFPRRSSKITTLNCISANPILLRRRAWRLRSTNNLPIPLKPSIQPPSGCRCPTVWKNMLSISSRASKQSK
jgi:hypothetical protein